MKNISKAAVGVVALIHLYFGSAEMFRWDQLVAKYFTSLEGLSEKTAFMAANQGLYNLFIAAGLIWALLIRDVEWQRKVALFFLICVAIAGVFGGMTAAPLLYFAQLIPAVLAIGAVLLAKPSPATDPR